MKLKCKMYRFERNLPKQAVTCLAELGLDFRRDKNQNYPRNPSFWMREEENLHFILHDAWRLFRQQIKILHPDKPSGNASSCRRLNQLFQRIKLLFKQKGITL